MSELVMALAGNPNCGKTSLFNGLTGAKQHVGNWPGVTVEKKEGRFKAEGREVTLVDLPGTYSLGAYSEDEVVARNFILKDKPDVVINVVDASNIERNLYLTMQLIETGAKVILALNMMDEARNKKIQIDVDKISKELNIPVISTIATKNQGLKELVAKAVDLADSKGYTTYKINYGKDVESEVNQLQKIISKNNVSTDFPNYWIATKLLEDDKYVKEYIDDRDKSGTILDKVKNSIQKLNNSLGYDTDAFIIDKRYEVISDVVGKSVKREATLKKETASDKIDRVVTNKWLGIPIFAIIMFLMYQVTMSFGNDYLGGFVGDFFDFLGGWVGNNLAYLKVPDLVTSFITDGLISGLGSVLTFVPMIFVMYFIISILEDTGYMARAAYVMDKLMNAVGLHGKTAVSLIIGSGCNVAGVMSTRTLESKKDRMIAILISPFMSCTARLAIYAVFISAFFSGGKIGIFSEGGIIIFLLYVLGISVAILVGKFLGKKVFKGETSYFIMELPPYRIPTVKSVFIHMWEKAGAFLKKAGTVIFGVVVIVWILSNLPAGVEPGTSESLIGMIGSFIAPIFKLAGYGTWQAGVALITGFAAKEAVVGTLGTIYGVQEGPTLIHAIQNTFTPLSSVSFMIMTLLYVPCVATIGAIKRETNSNKWAITAVIYTCAIGWVLSIIVYQVGRLMGFN